MEQVEQLQERQYEILEEIYRYGTYHSYPYLDQLNTEYNQIRDQLITILGDEVPCNMVDPDLWTTYVNIESPYTAITRNQVISVIGE
jgi:hypothetical protein